MQNGVQINSNNGLELFANESNYSKISNKLTLRGNVIIIDKEKNIKIESSQVEYDKNSEIIVSKNKTLIDIEDKYNIESENFKFLRLENIVKSDRKTVLKDKLKNKVETNNFIYFINKKKFKSKNLFITDKENNKYFSNDAAIDLSKNEIATKDIEVYFAKNGDLGENARLKGNSMLSNENSTFIKKGIFTTCKESDSCPPWSIQSKEIEHDKKTNS